MNLDEMLKGLKQEIPDNGFSQRVMKRALEERLAVKRKSRWLIDFDLLDLGATGAIVFGLLVAVLATGLWHDSELLLIFAGSGLALWLAQSDFARDIL